jgi:hypothetical protein
MVDGVAQSPQPLRVSRFPQIPAHGSILAASMSFVKSENFVDGDLRGSDIQTCPSADRFRQSCWYVDDTQGHIL